MIPKEQILNNLHAGVTSVTFTKVNGDRRVMQCTLNSGIIPTVLTETVPVTPRKENPDVQRVWDIEQQAWRSFRWDSVIDDTAPTSKET